MTFYQFSIGIHTTNDFRIVSLHIGGVFSYFGGLAWCDHFIKLEATLCIMNKFLDSNDGPKVILSTLFGLFHLDDCEMLYEFPE